MYKKPSITHNGRILFLIVKKKMITDLGIYLSRSMQDLFEDNLKHGEEQSNWRLEQMENPYHILGLEHLSS